MAPGDLTGTCIGVAGVNCAALKALIDSVNLPSVTDHLFLLPTANGQQIAVMKVVREV